eukprot:scaffold20.g7823.t1
MQSVSAAQHCSDLSPRSWLHQRRPRLAAPPVPRAAADGTAAAPPPAQQQQQQQSVLARVAEVATLLFPVWALISGTTAYFYPASLSWMTTTQFEQGVQLLMLSMGISLKTEEFKKAATRPAPILLGFACQYGIMPLVAFAISKLLHLHPAYATGLILLGCCPGGQASNVAAYVARGDLPVSLLMTTASTVAAAIMTPLLTSTLAGAFVPVSAWGLFVSTIKLVLVPTLAGLAINELFKKQARRRRSGDLPPAFSRPRKAGSGAATGMQRAESCPPQRALPLALARAQVDVVRPAMPLLALALTVVLCAVPVAQVAPVLRMQGLPAALPVFWLHSTAYLLGYFIPKWLGFNERIARTVSIESGMQSAAMGYALSTKHFSDILVAVPSSISIVVMVWMGAALAAAWRMIPITDEQGPAVEAATGAA